MYWKGLRNIWERIASDDAFGTFSHVVLGGCGRPRLSPQTKRRLFDVHEFRRVTGAARVFIRIKITLDGQRGEESHPIRPKSPQDSSLFRDATVSH